MFLGRLTSFGILCVALSAPNLAFAVRYEVTDLGTLGGVASEAYDVNNDGQVVGSSRNANNQSCAFLYQNGTMIGIDISVPDPSKRFGFAYSINASGQAAGYTLYQDGNNPPNYAFLYADGKSEDLGKLPGTSYTSTYAWGINDGGQVVGGCLVGRTGGGYPLYHAFLYSGGSMTDLGAPAEYPSTQAHAINSRGQVVGTMTNSSGSATRSFLYSGGSMTDIGVLSGYASASVSDINDNEQIVGTCFGSSQNHAFLYDDGSMTDLGGLPNYPRSNAYGINRIGQVVGSVSAADYSDPHAVLFGDEGAIDLNSLIPATAHWKLLRAEAISDNGKIVGTGINPAGQTRGFLLTPVPEPSTLALLGMGGIGLLTYVWRRRRV